MKRPIGCSFAMILAVAGWASHGGAQGADDKLYSIQVRAVPMAEKADGLATFRALRDKGYLVYAYKAEVKGEPWLRVAIGVFDSIDEVAVFGESFSAKEKQEHFVAVAPVRVTAGEGGDFVVTPSALWTRQGSKIREVLPFDDPPGHIYLRPSPDKKAVAFEYGEYGDRIYLVRLGDNDAKQLDGSHTVSDEDAKWLDNDASGGPGSDERGLRWSPSGRHIAFHNSVGWEFKSSLWVARADGSELRALVDNRSHENNRALKGFVWHPTDDRIFFVDGSFHSSSPGGSIRSVDMAGNVRTVLERDMKARLERNGPLRIEDGYLHYRQFKFDENYDRRTITDERIPLSDL